MFQRQIMTFPPWQRNNFNVINVTTYAKLWNICNPQPKATISYDVYTFIILNMISVFDTNQHWLWWTQIHVSEPQRRFQTRKGRQGLESASRSPRHTQSKTVCCLCPLWASIASPVSAKVCPWAFPLCGWTDPYVYIPFSCKMFSMVFYFERRTSVTAIAYVYFFLTS